MYRNDSFPSLEVAARPRIHRPIQAAWAALAALTAFLAAPASATVYVITDTRDVVATDLSCTLREALQAAVDRVAVDTCAAGTASNTIELGFGTYDFDQGLFLVPDSADPLDLEITGINGALVGTRVDLGDSNGFLRVNGVSFGTEVAHRLRIAGVQIQNGASSGAAVTLTGSGALVLENVNLVDSECIADCDLAASAVSFSGSGDVEIRDSFFARNGGLLAIFLRPADTSRVVIERTLLSANVGGLQVRAADNADILLEDVVVERAGQDGDTPLILFLELRGMSTTTARRVEMLDNIILSGSPASMSLSESATLTLEECSFERNLSPDSGALALSASGENAVEILDLVARNNTSGSGSSASEGAVRLTASGDASINWSRGEVRNNFTASSGFEPTAGATLVARNGGTLTAERLRLVGNRHVVPMDQAGARQATVIGDDPGSRLIFRNSLVASSPGRGMRASSIDGGEVAVLGSTFVSNDSTLFFGSGSDPVELRSHLWNCLFFDNDENDPVLSGDEINANAVANLVGVDPLFVDPATEDYRLLAGSPAIDGGLLTPVGVGSLDLGGKPRIVDGGVVPGTSTDVGAHEFQPGQLFGNGFESGDLLGWSSSTP